MIWTTLFEVYVLYCIGSSAFQVQKAIPNDTLTYKAIKTSDISIDKILNILFILLLCVSAWWIYDSVYVFNHANLGRVAGYKPDANNAAALHDLSKDAAAWITIYDSTLDYPIMQGDDNAEYLNKDPLGEYSLAGSIFLDSRNSWDFSDPYSLVYGHHMANYHMFGVIDKWESKEFFDNHRNGSLILENGMVYNIEIFAFLRADASNDEIFAVGDSFSNEQRVAFTKSMASIYYEPRNSHLLYLSTCASPLSTERIILACTIE